MDLDANFLQEIHEREKELEHRMQELNVKWLESDKKLVLLSVVSDRSEPVAAPEGNIGLCSRLAFSALFETSIGPQ